MKTSKVHGQPCWVVRNDSAELAITERGAHMAPVTFYRDTDRPIQPYYISPWQEENLDIDAPVLVPLRGDFFCMPFGGNAEPFEGETHPPHGEPAGSLWSLVDSHKSANAVGLTLQMKPTVRPGTVTKHVRLARGQNVVYSQEVLEGFSGRMPLGHHATLAVPETEGAMRVATSPFRFGMTNPTVFSNPVNREYQSFALNARFEDLRRVPLIWKDSADADCTRFPARLGFCDLLALFKEPSASPAWMAATVPQEGYLWFSLKDPRLLPTTVFWISNHGRHGEPWNGRNRCLGLEDVCGYFADGIAPASAPNCLTEQGIATSVELSPERPTRLNYIQGVAQIPPEFQVVESVAFEPGKIVFASPEGLRVSAPVEHGFIATGELPA